MNLLKKYKPILNELAEDMKIDAIIIFGSYSENNIKPLSDLDICIIPSKECSKDESNLFLRNSSKELDISIFNELPIPLQHKILEKGKIFHQKIELRKLKLQIRRQWRDFKPYLLNAYKKRGYPITQLD